MYDVTELLSIIRKKMIIRGICENTEYFWKQSYERSMQDAITLVEKWELFPTIFALIENFYCSSFILWYVITSTNTSRL